MNIIAWRLWTILYSNTKSLMCQCGQWTMSDNGQWQLTVSVNKWQWTRSDKAIKETKCYLARFSWWANAPKHCVVHISGSVTCLPHGSICPPMFAGISSSCNIHWKCLLQLDWHWNKKELVHDIHEKDDVNSPGIMRMGRGEIMQEINEFGEGRCSCWGNDTIEAAEVGNWVGKKLQWPQMGSDVAYG